MRDVYEGSYGLLSRSPPDCEVVFQRLNENGTIRVKLGADARREWESSRQRDHAQERVE